MTRFNLISDCHLDRQDLILPGGDVLIMAGDIVEAGDLRVADNANRNVYLADRYRRFFAEELKKYQKVLYVFGNHEFYNNVYEEAFTRIAKELPDNVQILEKDSTQIEDIQIFGGTLWTDLNKGDPITVEIVKNTMNDYENIRHSGGVYVKMAYGGGYWTHKFSVNDTKGLFHETMDKMKAFVESHSNEKVLIITHHAPTELSISRELIHLQHENAAYHSRLGDFILDHPNIKCWVHGHVHNAVDYTVGECRVVSNPRGYYGLETMAYDYDPSFSFEI